MTARENDVASGVSPFELERERRRADWAARAAEYGHSDDPVRGIILQLRQRGRVANVRTLWVLAALLCVIFIGLAYYLGLPFLRDALNGRKLALEDSIAAAEQTLASLDEERLALFPPLAEVLRQTPETL